MKRAIFAAIVAGTAALGLRGQTHGHLPEWKKGEFEIHHIYTGKGEANVLIFPDGTTMLIDAGDWNQREWNMTRALPDSSRGPGEWVARYVERVNPDGRNVDYVMASHFHSDHIGNSKDPDRRLTSGRNPDYHLTGLMEAGEWLRFGKAFDRGYPDYDYPLPMDRDRGIDAESDVADLRALWKRQNELYGMKMEKFVPGRLNQITLLRHPEKYPDFSIRNLAANGEIWTGEGEETVRYYDQNRDNLGRSQNENTKSLAMRFNYGPFSYYSGGDLCSSLKDESGNKVNLEVKVGEACGPVDVCKVNHHGHPSGTSEGFVKNVKAVNWILPVWDYWHISPTVVKRLIQYGASPGGPEINIFPQTIHRRIWQTYGAEPWLKALNQTTGHVVVKVAPGGKEYRIYVVTADDESGTVLREYGPYTSAKPR